MDVGTARGKFEIDGLQSSIDQLNILIDAIKKANVEMRTSRGEQIKLVTTYKELFPAISKAASNNKYFKGTLAAVNQAIADQQQKLSTAINTQADYMAARARAISTYGRAAADAIVASSKTQLDALNRLNNAYLKHSERLDKITEKQRSFSRTNIDAMRGISRINAIADSAAVARNAQDYASVLKENLRYTKAPQLSEFFTTKGLLASIKANIESNISKQVADIQKNAEKAFSTIGRDVKTVNTEINKVSKSFDAVGRSIEKDQLAVDKFKNKIIDLQRKKLTLTTEREGLEGKLGYEQARLSLAKTPKEAVMTGQRIEAIKTRIQKTDIAIEGVESKIAVEEGKQLELLNRINSAQRQRNNLDQTRMSLLERQNSLLSQQRNIVPDAARRITEVEATKPTALEIPKQRAAIANERMASYGTGYMQNNPFAALTQRSKVINALNSMMGGLSEKFKTFGANVTSAFAKAGPPIDSFIGKVGSLTNSIKTNIDWSNSWWKRYGEVATGFWVAYRAINAFEMGISKVTSVIANGIKIQDEYREGAATISGMLALTSTGLSGFAERYTRINTVMIDSIREATRLAPQYRLSMDEVIEGYKELSQFGVLVTRDIADKSLNVISMIKMIAKTTGSDVRQVRQEIQALFTGTKRTTDQFGRMISIMMPETAKFLFAVSGDKQLKTAQEKWTILIDRMWEYKYAVMEANKTISGQSEILQSNVSIISAYALETSGVYNKIMNTIRDFNLALFDKKGNLTAYGQEVYGVLFRVWQMVGLVFDAFVGGIKFIYNTIKAFNTWYNTSDSLTKNLVTGFAVVLVTVAKLNIALQATWFLLNLIGRATGLNVIVGALWKGTKLAWAKRAAILAIIKAMFDWQGMVIRSMYLWDKVKGFILKAASAVKVLATRMWTAVAPLAMITVKAAGVLAMFGAVYWITQKAMEGFSGLAAMVREFGSILKKAFTEGFTSVDWSAAFDQVLDAGAKAVAEQAARNKAGNDMVINYAKEKFGEFTGWIADGATALVDKLKSVVSFGTEKGMSLAERLFGLGDVTEMTRDAEADIKKLLEGIEFAGGIAGKNGEGNKELQNLLERRKELIVSYFNEINKIKGDISEVMGISTLNKSIADAETDLQSGLSKIEELEREFNNVGDAIAKLGLKYEDFKGVDLTQKNFPTALVVAFQEALLKLRDVKVEDAFRKSRIELQSLSHAYDNIIYINNPLQQGLEAANKKFEEQKEKLDKAGASADAYAIALAKLEQGRALEIRAEYTKELLRQQSDSVSRIRDQITSLDDVYENYEIKTQDYLVGKINLLDQISNAENARLELMRAGTATQEDITQQEIRVNEIFRERLALQRELQTFGADGLFQARKAFLRFERDVENFGQGLQDTFYNIFTDAKDTLSDVFFDWMKGELDDATDYWQAFGDAIYQAIADLGSQAVSKLITGTIGDLFNIKGESEDGIFGGLFGGGQTGGNISNSYNTINNYYGGATQAAVQGYQTSGGYVPPVEGGFVKGGGGLLPGQGRLPGTAGGQGTWAEEGTFREWLSRPIRSFGDWLESAGKTEFGMSIKQGLTKFTTAVSESGTWVAEKVSTGFDSMLNVLFGDEGETTFLTPIRDAFTWIGDGLKNVGTGFLNMIKPVFNWIVDGISMLLNKIFGGAGGLGGTSGASGGVMNYSFGPGKSPLNGWESVLISLGAAGLSAFGSPGSPGGGGIDTSKAGQQLSGTSYVTKPGTSIQVPVPTGPPRALGGPITNKMPTLVGENGAEFIIPKAPGYVLPNNKINNLVSGYGSFVQDKFNSFSSDISKQFSSSTTSLASSIVGGDNYSFARNGFESVFSNGEVNNNSKGDVSISVPITVTGDANKSTLAQMERTMEAKVRQIIREML